MPSFSVDFSAAIHEPLGLVGFALFLVFLALAFGVRTRAPRWLLATFVVMAVVSWGGGLTLAALSASAGVNDAEGRKRSSGGDVASQHTGSKGAADLSDVSARPPLKSEGMSNPPPDRKEHKRDVERPTAERFLVLKQDEVRDTFINPENVQVNNSVNIESGSDAEVARRQKEQARSIDAVNDRLEALVERFNVLAQLVKQLELDISSSDAAALERNFRDAVKDGDPELAEEILSEAIGEGGHLRRELLERASAQDRPLATEVLVAIVAGDSGNARRLVTELETKQEKARADQGKRLESPSSPVLTVR